MLSKLFNIKKRFFQHELAQTEAAVWSTEFALYTTRFEYESTRQLLSSGQDQLNQVNSQLKNDADNKVLAEQAATLEKKLEQLRTTLDDYNVMMNGSDPNDRYPEGVRGLSDKIRAQVQKREHIKNFIKHNC